MSNNSIQRFSSLKFSRMLKRNKTISQINVTPMVDVMLVLLVIFMITAPLLKVGVPINLPKTKAKALPEDQTPLSITINKEEKIFVQFVHLLVLLQLWQIRLQKRHFFACKVIDLLQKTVQMTA